MSSKTNSIIELIRCELFKDIYMVLYFHEHYDKPAVVAALIEKLKSMSIVRQLRILPCLIYVFQNHPDKAFQRLLLEFCEDNFGRFLIVKSAAIQIKWAFNAYTFNRQLPQDRLEEFENIRNVMAEVSQKMDSHSINGKEVDFASIPEDKLHDYVTQWAQEKTKRAEFMGLVNDFYCELTNICLRLKSQPQQNRKQKLQLLLRKTFARHLLKSNMHGVFFPVSDTSNFVQSHLIQLVNIIYEQCFPFSTKQRVPYKLVFETVNHEELAKNEQLVNFDILSTFPKHVMDDLQDTEDTPDREGSECMTVKEAEIATKVNTFIAEARRANTMSEEQFGAIEKRSSIPERIDLPSPSLKLQHSYFGQDWECTAEIIRERSPFKDLESYRVRSYLVKAGDDLRQEFFSMQLIKMVRDIFVEQNLKLWIQPYEIIMFNRNEGFIEFLPNTMTISSLKRYGDRPLRKIYQQIFGQHEDRASTNFMNSLAGYSLVCYIFQIKDRHNGNLLIDSAGHIIHIDFSFILSKCPGNIKFEKAPFKLTQDYIDLLGGLNGDMFRQFKELLFMGFKFLRKYATDLIKYVEAIRDKNDLPCFQYYDKAQFEGRLMLRATDEQLRKHVETLVSYAARSYTTAHYDRFQYYTNNILK